MIEKFKKYYDNILIGFVVNILFVYACWKVLLKASQVLEPFKTHWDAMMASLANLIAAFAYVLLLPFYDNLNLKGPWLYLTGKHGVSVGPACVGIGVTFMFVGLILSYRGPIKLKLKFIVGGSLSILLLNAIRNAVLCIIAAYKFEWTEFNHKFVFNNLIYIFILVVWAWYVNLAGKSEMQKIEDAS
jgi:exosortase/archaeosortase family protein